VGRESDGKKKILRAGEVINIRPCQPLGDRGPGATLRKEGGVLKDVYRKTARLVLYTEKKVTGEDKGGGA